MLPKALFICATILIIGQGNNCVSYWKKIRNYKKKRK